jgi:cell division protein ZapA (FtsZ GTPase activity inhibitor)
MITPIKVSILGKDYTLRVEEDTAAETTEMAEYLDSQLRAFKSAHTEQSDLTAAIITGLAITEKLFLERSRKVDPGKMINAELDILEKKLTDALV